MYVYIHLSVHVCIFIDMHTYSSSNCKRRVGEKTRGFNRERQIRLFIYIHTYIYTYIFICTYFRYTYLYIHISRPTVTEELENKHVALIESAKLDYLFTYIRMFIYTYIYICIYLYIHIYKYIFIYTYESTNSHRWVGEETRGFDRECHIKLYIHIFIYICLFIHMYIHVCIFINISRPIVTYELENKHVALIESAKLDYICTYIDIFVYTNIYL
jgi:hypothetical protein